MSAYNKHYLEDASDLQETLFQEITRYKYEIDYEHFVKGYMKCKYRKLMDAGSTRVINMTWDELIYYIERDCQSILRHGEVTIDRLQSGWIGRMYNILQYRLNISSEELYGRLPLKKMQLYFVPLHTVGEDVAIKKLLSNIK